MSMDEALERVGGFGRQQWIALFACMVARQSANIFVYTFPYFIFPQKYLCKSDDGT